MTPKPDPGAADRSASLVQELEAVRERNAEASEDQLKERLRSALDEATRGLEAGALETLLVTARQRLVERARAQDAEIVRLTARVHELELESKQSRTERASKEPAMRDVQQEIPSARAAGQDEVARIREGLIAVVRGTKQTDEPSSLGEAGARISEVFRELINVVMELDSNRVDMLVLFKARLGSTGIIAAEKRDMGKRLEAALGGQLGSIDALATSLKRNVSFFVGGYSVLPSCVSEGIDELLKETEPAEIRTKHTRRVIGVDWEAAFHDVESQHYELAAMSADDRWFKYFDGFRRRVESLAQGGSGGKPISP